jgi:hypothetical protein
MDEGGSVDEASLSEEAPWRGPWRGAASLGILKDMLRTSLDAGISLHGGPFPSEIRGEPGMWGGGARIPRTLMDE